MHNRFSGAKIRKKPLKRHKNNWIKDFFRVFLHFFLFFVCFMETIFYICESFFKQFTNHFIK